MGECLSKMYPSSEGGEEATAAASKTATTDNLAGSSSSRTATTTTTTTKKSLAYFDAVDDEHKKKKAAEDLEIFKSQFRGTAYFDALDSAKLLGEEELDVIEEEEEEEESFRYAPAKIANPNPRGSVAFEQPSTMLAIAEKKKFRASSFVGKLAKPKHKVDIEGYPGSLTQQELDACIAFRKCLKEKDPAYLEMVKAWSNVEEEPYAICRFMRARNFDVDPALEMVDENIPKWKEAANADFYPSLEQAIGCSAAVFFTQFPAIFGGLGKNGTVVQFMRCGSMSVEGMECLVELDQLSKYFWNTLKYKLTNQVKYLHEANPAVVVRCEEIAVIDLKHLTSAQVSRKAIDALKNMAEPTGCFPELVNTLIILNAPGFFSWTWAIIKVFLDPRTARKVEIYSDETKGKQRLKEILEAECVPCDYGGRGASFEEMAQEQYCQDGHRQIGKHLSTHKHGGKTDWDFTLAANEQATVTVYTRSSAGADFVISSNNETVAESLVENNGQSGPYSKEIASKLDGPGTFKVHAHSRSKEAANFVVIVDVTLS